MIKKCPEPVSDEGVSEVIGAILLVSLSVIGIAVISVMLFSSAPSEVVPVVDILAGKSGTGEFYLYNNGGDSLKSGEYRVLVDLNDGNGYVPGDFSAPSGGTWSPGDGIKYVGPGMPIGTKIVYIGGDTETLLSSSPVLYSNQTVANVSVIGDIGTSTGGDDINITESPIEITNDEDELAVEFEVRMNEPVLNVTIDKSVFVADRVDIVYYDYDHTGDGGAKDAIAQTMDTTDNVDYQAVISGLQVLLSTSDLPANVSLSIIGYNETEGTTYMTNGMFLVSRNNK
ncbi:type IV pilin N-terminal domain-containing protein [Methanoplanus endosymbiosus]|uniref:Type IV pilin N-terminal domain-containing protein n=1 Tax=Methanoplanus endosymbiosus TaxID=33865 RepID=A0A9E7THS2_9EURY|nr:type IV pilin N-terminal domain-containing protein [Methanoplanus endosymbiosus]UUX93462.1 type IV pilin N-terminal domain-containing protein [Methanoplanus endosymbiosus]